ncbi:hypothetical protein OAJ35_01805 [Gammaproteobacteria bacterium]|nr:hypothetical protein [Gammaproteobacteria bacterium]
MNISKNQIWVLIGIVAIGVIALVSDIEVKVEVGPEYSFEDECKLRESQLCPTAEDTYCYSNVSRYCKALDLPDKP